MSQAVFQHGLKIQRTGKNSNSASLVLKRWVLIACGATLLIGCEKQSYSRVSGEIVISLKNGETLRPNSVEILLVDRNQAGSIYAFEGNHKETNFWTRSMYMNCSLLCGPKLSSTIDPKLEQNINQLPPDSEDGKWGREFLETLRKSAEQQKLFNQNVLLQQEKNEALLRKATFKVLTSDSTGRFSFEARQPVTNVALFAKVEKEISGAVELFIWLLPLADTNVQTIFLSNSNLLSEADAFYKTDGPNVGLSNSQHPESAEVASLKARVKDLETAANTQKAKPNLDPVEQLKTAINTIEDKDWSVVSYDVQRTDSLVNPIVAQVDIVMSLASLGLSSKVGYQAYLTYDDGVWILKGLTKSIDRDGSIRLGRMKEVPRRTDQWGTIERLFER